MEIFKVALFGHKDLTAHKRVEKGLSAVLCELMRTKQFVELYVGRNGEFDLFAASIVKRVQKDLGRENSSMTLILPYVTRDIEFYAQYYDSVMIPECIDGVHPKGAITKRNRWMVEECDLLICYVEREFGGAYNALQYAKKLGKKTINLAEKE